MRRQQTLRDPENRCDSTDKRWLGGKMNNQTKIPKEMKETFGGYMSVDRIEALKYNWETIQKLRLPRAIPVSEETQKTKKHGT